MRIAVYQGAARLLDPKANLDRLDQLATICALERVELLLLPELFLTGYNLGADCTAMAETLDGPSARQAASVARRHGVALIWLSGGYR